MFPRLQSVLRDMHRVSISLPYFFGHSHISLQAENYFVRGYVPDLPLPKGINFNSDQTPCAVVLATEERAKIREVAVGGFAPVKSALDCLQIQGRRGSYRELTPVNWQAVLLSTIIGIGRTVGAEAVTLVPSTRLQLDDAEDIERAKKNYDRPALALGFRLSELEDRYVLELR